MKTTSGFRSNSIYFLPLKKEHIALVNTLHAHPEVARYNTIGVPKDLETTAKILAHKIDENQESALGWALYDTRKNFIGEAGIILAPQRFQKAEISYSLAPDQWNKGLGTEIAKQLIQYCFNDLGLHRVEAGVAVHNHASIRVLEKAGMDREGTHRKILPLSSGWTDNYAYAILKEEWKALERNL